MEERLQKYIANQGITSRRKAEEAIIEGKVQVNRRNSKAIRSEDRSRKR